MKNKVDSPGYDSFDLIRFIFRYKWTIAVITFLAAVVSIIVSLQITPKYASSVILFPKSQTAASQALTTGELINPDDHLLNFGEEEATEQLIQALHSEEITNTIIERFDLMNHYQIEREGKYPMTELYREYADNVTFRRTEYRAVEIKVLDKDPRRAAQIANTLSALLDSTLNSMQQQVAQEVYQAVKASYTQQQQEVKKLEDSLFSLSRKEQLENPVLANMLKNEGQRLSQLRGKLAEAHFNATAAISRKFTVSKAYPAEKKSYPVRWLIVVLSTFSAFLFAIFATLFFDRYKDLIFKK
ncbi:MAG: Wzz/FepE/Etk N-terminal domain-containing protein [Bacteroidota bacterium]